MGRVGPQVHAGAGQQGGADSEAVCGVVVSADHDGWYAEVGHLVQALAEQAYRVQAGDGPVVDVSGDEQGVDLLVAGSVADVIKDFTLGVDQVFSVEPAAQVPVRSMQKPHAR